ncbi:unnamed protein product [Rhizophagus irregularis]|nr:unnamed protein product [Rhizophagus irregularis]
MAIIVTFGEVGFRYSRFPKRHNVQENAKFQHEYSLMALLDSETELNVLTFLLLFFVGSGGSGALGFPKQKMFRWFRCSRIPETENVQENAKFQHEYSLMALLDSETEMFRNCERRRFLFDSPGFRNGKCSGGSGAPGFRNRKCLQVGVSLESEIGSSGIRDLDSFDFWYWIGILGPSPPASILGLDNV